MDVENSQLIALKDPELPIYFGKLEEYIKTIFDFKGRNATLRGEVFAGLVHFLSCIFILPVVSRNFGSVGYNSYYCCVTTATCMALGSIVAGVITNLPFVMSPAASIFIFMSSYLKQRNFGESQGNQAVVISGFLMMALFHRPLLLFLGRLIPQCIQVSTAIGVGLITALAGCLDVNLIVTGAYTIVDLGAITPETQIAMAGFVMVAILRHFKVVGAFLIVLIFNSVVYWAYSDSWSTAVAITPSAPLQRPLNQPVAYATLTLAFELAFLYVIVLNGMSKSFSDLAGITNSRNLVPRARWLYLVCGACTVFSGFFGGPTIIVSPESGAGIQCGAKTGFSSVVAGLCYAVAVFFSPILHNLPPASIAPLLISLGAVSFANTKKIDFADYRVAWPAFTVLFLVPFTYSILLGVTYGWLLYLIVNFFSGDLYKHTKTVIGVYTPELVHNVFTIFLDKYVPAIWLTDSTAAAAQTNPPGTSSSASPSPAPAPSQAQLDVKPSGGVVTGGHTSFSRSWNQGQGHSEVADPLVVNWSSIRRSLWNDMFDIAPADEAFNSESEDSGRITWGGYLKE